MVTLQYTRDRAYRAQPDFCTARMAHSFPFSRLCFFLFRSRTEIGRSVFFGQNHGTLCCMFPLSDPLFFSFFSLRLTFRVDSRWLKMCSRRKFVFHIHMIDRAQPDCWTVQTLDLIVLNIVSVLEC